MINCNITANFFKEFRRMCDSHGSGCGMCQIREAKGGMPCSAFVRDNIEKVIKIVQKWSDEHPQKTILDDLKEKYPNYRTIGDVPRVCPYDLGYDEQESCIYRGNAITCEDCWNRPLDEVIKK